MTIAYQEEAITAEEFADILGRSGLGARRPTDDLPRLQRMLDGTDLLITARDSATGSIVGVARSLSDWPMPATSQILLSTGPISARELAPD